MPTLLPTYSTAQWSNRIFGIITDIITAKIMGEKYSVSRP